MFPTLSEAITGERISVGPPFFNKWMVPIGLVLLFLTGVGPLIAWRKATVSHLRYQFTWPALAAAVAVVACVAIGPAPGEPCARSSASPSAPSPPRRWSRSSAGARPSAGATPARTT